MSYRTISYWFDSLGVEPVPRAPLPGDLEVDVAIVGGGYTGLWTAYYLKQADPSCRVAVLERDTAGFGASGRNGGWCWPSIAGLEDYQESDPEKGAELREAIKATIDEVGVVCQTENIQADFLKGGGISIARNHLQAKRMRGKLEQEWADGWSEDMEFH